MRENVVAIFIHVEVLFLILARWLPSADAHGSLVVPLPRNAVERSLPWSARPRGCQCAGKEPGTRDANNDNGCDTAQACYWFNNGCFIGCDECVYNSSRSQMDICGKGMKATMMDAEQRTVNKMQQGGSDLDIYQHNPWRAPGYAPVTDSCGLAGGSLSKTDEPEGAEYSNSHFATRGDRGSEVLPYFYSGETWYRGFSAEVIWQIKANHGGGYMYRLCPLGENLTEECFNKMPLEFVKNSQQLLWNNGTRLPIKATYMTKGTWPPGSMWAMNPVPPRCLGGGCSMDAACTACPKTIGSSCMTCDNKPEPKFTPPCDEADKPGICSGNQPSQWGPVAIVDRVFVPLKIRPGDYVLSWRWDCEATAQIWTNCADIQIQNPLHG